MRSTIRRAKRHENDNDAASTESAQPPVNGQVDGQGGIKSKSEKEPPEPTTTFWEFISGLGDRWQTEDLSLYVYRLWPVTDKRNPERFLCKLHEPVDEDYLLKHFGSGKYWLVLNNTHGKHLRKHVANPHNPDFPPRVSREEVVESDPRNRLFFDVWASKEGHPSAAPRTEKNGAGDNGSDAIKELAGLVKLAFGDKRKEEADSVTKTLIDWALAQKDRERSE